MLYRARRNIALARDGRHVIVRSGEPVDPAWLSEAGLARLLARRYVQAEVDAPDIPVTAIRGIGPERAKGLAAIGITSAAGLLATDPEELEKRLSSLTVRQIEDWHAQARILLQTTLSEAVAASPKTGEVAVVDSRRKCERCS